MLSIILPTYNEAANLPELLERISGILREEAFEVIVVDDDSPDKTWEAAELLKQKHPMLKVIRRIGRRGLSSAVVEGFAAAKGDILLVMDADLQHDPAIILQLKEGIEKGADIAIASRYMAGGSVGAWVSGRRILSKTATFLAKKLPPVEVSDPMSGFFALKADAFRRIQPSLRPSGFKILLEILTFLPRGTKTAEVPLDFKLRTHGESKLSLRVEAEFLLQILRIALYRLQWPLLLLALAMALVFLVPRVWPLRQIYLNPVMRNNVQITLQREAAHNGWLISDLSVREIYGDHMMISRRQHVRGEDPEECYILYFDDRPAEPCES
jgi:glycosyltransferase involved in cell wall biosynthesis